MKLWILSLAASVLLLFAWYYRAHPLISKVEIRGARFTVDVAATEPLKQRGLGGRDGMGESHGMLFPYDHKEQYNFWMKDMRFALDFVWIDGKVVADITENVPPPGAGARPALVKPSVPVDAVLELNAGTVKRYGIRVGDSVRFLDR